MRKVFISAGHSNVKGKDRGASGNGFVEGVEAAEYRNLLVASLRRRGIEPIVDKDDSILSQTLNYFRNLTTNKCIVIDIHFNSASASATGTETLIPSKNTEFERLLAKAMSDATSRILNIPLRGNHAGLRGVKTELESHHGRLGWMRLTGENILLELCFISNSQNMKSYDENKELLAEEHARIISNFAKGFTEEVKSSSIVHTVVDGDTVWSLSRRYGVTPGEISSKNGIVGGKIIVGQVLKIK